MIEYIEYIPQVEQAILPLLTAVGGLAQVGMSLAQRTNYKVNNKRRKMLLMLRKKYIKV